jgi:hypothetical protein
MIRWKRSGLQSTHQALLARLQELLGDGAATICDMQVPASVTGRRGEAAQLLHRLDGVERSLLEL